jgi:hypothetical protein
MLPSKARESRKRPGKTVTKKAPRESFQAHFRAWLRGTPKRDPTDAPKPCKNTWFADYMATKHAKIPGPL